jgi:hypothetical protein
MLRVATLLFVIGIVSATTAAEPQELVNARGKFDSLQQPTEADRVRYITQLVRLRESLTRQDADKMLAIDKEIMRHPMSMPPDSHELAKLIVGKWTSPRHQYLYRTDGSWTMLPEFIDGEKATHGIWHVDGNRFSQGQSNADASPETIILLTATDFVWSTRGVYYMRRGDAFPWRE